MSVVSSDSLGPWFALEPGPFCRWEGTWRISALCQRRRSPFTRRHGRRQAVLPTIQGDDGPLARLKPTGSALLDAPFSDGVRADTKPDGFELLRPRPRPFRKASPARHEGSQPTRPARLCPTSVRIRELSYSSSLDHAVLKGPIQGQITLGRATSPTAPAAGYSFPDMRT
jgi:hypothetical protein